MEPFAIGMATEEFLRNTGGFLAGAVLLAVAVLTVVVTVVWLFRRGVRAARKAGETVRRNKRFRGGRKL